MAPQNAPVRALVEAAAGYPGFAEDFPWGERVAKVDGKVFAFMGMDESADPSVSLKLPRSAHYALSLDACRPTSHGLGKAGWVSIEIDQPDCPDLALLLEWLDESYRSRAGKRNLAVLDGRAAPTPE